MRPSYKPNSPFIKTVNLKPCNGASVSAGGDCKGGGGGARPDPVPGTSVILMSRCQDVTFVVGWQDVTGLPSRDAFLQPGAG